MSGHTKGPWFRLGSKIFALPDLRDRRVADVQVADTEGQSNATLIVAAPEILVELESLYEELEKYMHTPHPEGVAGAGKYLLRMQKARAAIAKAKGEAQ